MQISTRTLVTVAKATAIFMAKRDVRHYLMGAHLAKRDGGLIVETTDGHRVAQVRIDCEAGPDFDVIVGRDSWLAVSKIKTTKKDDSTVSLTVDSGKMMLTQTTGATLPLDLIDGKYPNVSRVLRVEPNGEAEPQITMAVNAEYAFEVFKAAAILANPKYKGTKIITTDAKSILTIETPTDHGEFDGLTAPALFAVMPMRL
jgi:DNA polymerase III sliding clamp (beta) subunit (PCNA family)